MEQNIEKDHFRKPSQEVIETEDKFCVDGQPIEFVSNVTTKHISQDVVEINVTFLAKSYQFGE
ncbi:MULTISPECIES: hypothetical protein [Leuconostoc]|uniref:hypothetical protein n=1 Tax=Leuconostoc TaxID=1243 RepID=UPI0032DE8873